MFICCGVGWSRVWCILDNLNHSLRIKWQWLCDKHDKATWGEDTSGV